MGKNLFSEKILLWVGNTCFVGNWYMDKIKVKDNTHYSKGNIISIRKNQSRRKK